MKPCGIVGFVLFIVCFLALRTMGEDSEVHETVLPNGLKVLTKEVHAAPIVTFMIWYKVGSRNEVFGKTGISHLLEHMQFKGTKRFGKGEIDKIIRRNGGFCNGATWRDFTYYYETLSSDKLELAIQIEADRMVNSILDPKEFEVEKTVVLSELEGNQNNPDYLIFYELYALAFKAHPYHWPTIGWAKDLETITRDELYTYYRTFYQPNNATVVIVGDFETEKALGMVRKYFGRIPRGPEPAEVTVVEPEQTGERRAEVRGPGATHRVMMGYHIPAVGHPDLYALDVLEIVLSRGTSSRLYKSLVDGKLATEAWASNTISRDPNLFLIAATAREGVSIQAVEAALLAEVTKLQTELIGDSELEKARKQLEAQFVYANDSVTDQAHQLGEMETIYSWRWLEEYLRNVQKVTASDVQRVARRYLTASNRTVVVFVPEVVSVEVEPSPAVEEKPIGSPVVGTEINRGRAVSPNEPPMRTVLKNGMTVIVRENHSNPTVAIEGSVYGGSAFDPQGKSGVASLTAQLLLKGTSKHTADEIAEELDSSAMSLDVRAEVEVARFSGYALSRDTNRLLSLIAEVLSDASFPESEFEKTKARRISAIREDLDSPDAMVRRAFFGAVFPEGHPYHRLSVDEEIEQVRCITSDDVRVFYQKHYRPENVILVIVGDVESEEIMRWLNLNFGEWAGGGPPNRPTIPEVPLQVEVVRKMVPMAGKSQMEIIVGYPGGLKRSDPDYYAATVMNFILGGGGALGSRLGDVIRDEMGLVYSVYSTFSATLGAGAWFAQMGVNPRNAERAMEELLRQMALIREKGVSAEEMKEAVDFITGSFPVRMEKNDAIAGILHAAELYGLGMDYISRYTSLYKAVTLEQVNAAARKYLHPEAYTIVLAGPIESK